MEIILDNAIIVEVEPITPEWLPTGVNNEEFKDFESENHKYTAKEIIDILEANGLEKNSTFEHQMGVCPASWEPKNYNTYWKSGNDYGCYIFGKENLFGASPLYYYKFTINPDTDTLDYAKCTLEFFEKK